MRRLLYALRFYCWLVVHDAEWVTFEAALRHYDYRQRNARGDFE